MGEVTANVEVTILHQQGLHLNSITVTALNLKVPGTVNLTGGCIQNHEVVDLLAVNLGEFTADR